MTCAATRRGDPCGEPARYVDDDGSGFCRGCADLLFDIGYQLIPIHSARPFFAPPKEPPMIQLSSKAIDAELLERARESRERLQQQCPDVAKQIEERAREIGAVLALLSEQSLEGGDQLLAHLAATRLDQLARDLGRFAAEAFEEARDRAV